MAESPPTVPGPYEFLKSIETAEATLFLSYTANLDFFERFALRQVLRQQATATLISDPAKVSGDPVLVTKAGTRYVPAFATCSGGTAFHPKLIVVASGEQVSIAIGSGNLTLSGWHGNDELWTFVHATREKCPSTISDVHRFLELLLDGRIRISSIATRGVEKIVDLLASWRPTTDGPRAVSSLDGSILRQLPRGPVERLSIHSPFFDHNLDALEAVRRWFDPRAIDITLQKDTSVDGQSLTKWAETHGANLRWAADAPYRHGKLLEWLDNDRWNSLTGSPNLSSPALLNSVEAIGNRANCELGLLALSHPSLTPPEKSRSSLDPVQLNFSGGRESRDSLPVTILSASIDENLNLNLELASPLPIEMRLQRHAEESDWTTTDTVESFPAGMSEINLRPCPFPAGTPLRLFSGESTSNTVFVTDPVRTSIRPMRWEGPELGSFPDLVLNSNLQEIYKVAEQIRQQEARFGPEKSRESKSTSKTDDESPSVAPTLADRFELITTVLSEEMLRWSLALPSSAGSGASAGGTNVQLVEETNDEAADTGQATDGAEPQSDVDAILNATPHQRRSLRKFCEGSLEDAGPWPNVTRSLAARAIVNGCAGGLWDEDEMCRTLERLVRLLTAPHDEPNPDEAQAISAYLGISLAILRSGVVRLSVDDENSLRFRRTAKMARPYLGEIPQDRVNEVAQHLIETFGETVSSRSVAQVAEQISLPEEPLEAAARLIQEETDISISIEGPTIRMLDPLPLVFEYNLLEVARFVRGPSATVVGRIESGQPVALIWREPHLILLKRNPAGDLGRMYTGPAASPRSLIAGWNMGAPGQENFPKPASTWFPGQTESDLAKALINEVSGALG